MTRYLKVHNSREIIVIIARRGKAIQIREYFLNLGSVSRTEYTQTKSDGFNYIAKNREQLVREAEELIKKTKKLEVC